MPSTYDLINQARYLLTIIEADEGVLTEATEAELLNWLSISEDKLHACLAARKRIDSEAELLREEEKRIAARRKALETASDRILELATGLLLERETMGEEPKVKTSHYTAWLGETQSILGPDEVSEWPEAWRRVKVEADKSAAMREAKNGAQLPNGFHLVTKRSVRFR